MELTIYNTYVVMESQEQCDRMKHLCIDYGLPYWDNPNAFYMHYRRMYLIYSCQAFFCVANLASPNDITKVTEQEFINLLKNKTIKITEQQIKDAYSNPELLKEIFPDVFKESIEITLEQIAEKFNVSVNNIKIVK